MTKPPSNSNLTLDSQQKNFRNYRKASLNLNRTFFTTAVSNRFNKDQAGLRSFHKKILKEQSFDKELSEPQNEEEFNYQSFMSETNSRLNRSIDREANRKLLSERKSLFIDHLKSRKISEERVQPKIKFVDPIENRNYDENNYFMGMLPTFDIPRNKLTSQIRDGIQVLVDKMRKRESYYADLQRVEDPYWNPPPRESATLVTCNYRSYLIGGLSFEAMTELAQVKVTGEFIQWSKVEYECQEKVLGRLSHTSLPYKDKIITFGGSFMYNKKRQIRECLNQVIIFDTFKKSFNIQKTQGISVQPRKNHCAAIYSKTILLIYLETNMIVFGGYIDNGTITDEVSNLDLESFDWSRIQTKTYMEPLAQSACATDLSNIDGIYSFGGRNPQGELNNKIRLLKFEEKEDVYCPPDWSAVREKGQPPVARMGHTMEYLPVQNALLIVGGRNDDSCKKEQTPFLNDIFLFLLDEFVWVQVKYANMSHRLDKLSNHCMTVITNNENYEKILIFGGVQSKLSNIGVAQSSISKQLYTLDIKYKP